ncbi:N-acetylmuramoyl-L-alanine amidase [Amycolatopsis kentuckyensis]|uniref:N-acetylmuramoyl-L-alanine amidase n=1 Tax=Amycolatopsis kentuckyensis TaxID=218823 RepID=UPI0035631EAB
MTDRFPMLGFTIRTDGPGVAEVVVATDPALFVTPASRTSSTFYSSREHGLLSLPGGDAVYTVRPDVLARFIHAERLYFGLATATSAAAGDWRVVLLPTAQSPYISLAGLSDRALRRVRMYPARNGSGYGGNGSRSVMEWAGDRARPGTVPATPATPPVAAEPAAPAPGPEGTPGPPPPYDDGFGPLPPLRTPDVSTGATSPPVPVPAAQQGAGRPGSRTFEFDPETAGIEDAVLDDAPAPQAMALGVPPLGLTGGEYPGVTRIMASPAFSEGRRGHAIDRIVIHITGAPQTPYIGSWFAREDADTSAHYMVDQNGDIIQFVREQDTAWHARGANRRSIGIEHVAIQQGGARYPRPDGSVKTFPYTPPTDVEYRASAELAAHLCRKYALTPDRATIAGHREVDRGTTHTSCPDGAWDWDRYMTLVGEFFAAQPVAQGLGSSLRLRDDPENMAIESSACSDVPAPATATALALSTGEYERVARAVPSPAFTAGRAGTAVDRIVIHITDAPTTSSTVNHFARADADSSAHYLVGQDGEVVQFVSEADTAWHAKGANRRSVGIEHVAVKEGGVTYGGTTFPYLPPTETQYGESAALVLHLCQKYGLTPDRATIIGHSEADPGTTHTSCPAGAWDWDYFMQLVTAAASSAQPAAQALGLVEPARRRLTAVSMEAESISVSAERQRITPPLVETVPELRALAIQALLAANPALTPLVLVARAAAEAAGVSIGIGPQVGAGLLAGIGLGAGIVFAPGNVMGVYGQVEIDAGFIASIGASVQLTVVSGGLDAFRGLGYAAGISGGEGLTGGAAALFDEQLHFQGVTLQVGVGAGLSPIDIYTSVQHAVAGQLGLAGPRPASALGTSGETVEIRYRVFIPAPVIKGPNSGYDLGPIASGEDFSGDGRDFGYDQGTSRAEITATLTLGMDNSMSGPTTVSRLWGESKAYDSSYTHHVGGKPGWWLDKQAGLEPLRRATLPVSDDNLSISRGASSLQRSVLAVTSGSAVVSIKVAGALPLITSPDIDADICVYLKRGSDGGIQVMVVGDHDGFPCHELYVNRQEIYTYDPVAAGSDPTNLLPPTDREISTGWVSVPLLATADAQAYAAARTLDIEDWSINWDDVFPVGQPTGNSCWATAAAIIDGWRRQQSVSADDIARFDGLTTEKGLPAASHARFAEAIGFTVHPNACYTPEGFRDILEANGPVWVAAKVPSQHAIVVTGMYRQDGQHYVRITDPWDRVVGAPGAPGAYAATPAAGSRYILTYEQFAAEFEAAGGTGFAQLLHTGGTHGQVINRGSASGAGYALSAGTGQAADGAGPQPSSGIVSTRKTTEQDGRFYDLAQLSGFFEPSNPPAGGAGMPPLPGERVVLDDWPYIEGPNGRTQAGVAIDWQYRNGGVGEVAVTPVSGQVLEGWTAKVRADITPEGSTRDRVTLKVRVTTTFSRAGEEDEVAVTDVTLSGDGRRSTLHGVDPAPQAASPAGNPATPVPVPPQPVPA